MTLPKSILILVLLLAVTVSGCAPTCIGRRDGTAPGDKSGLARSAEPRDDAPRAAREACDADL